MSGTDSDTDVGQNVLADERDVDVDEEHMDDNDDSREYSVETSNSYSVLGGDGQGMVPDREWVEVQRNKRKRINTGSVDEQTFQTMTNDEKLDVIFSKLIGIEQRQNMIEKFETSLNSTDSKLNSIGSKVTSNSISIELLSYRSIDLEARSRRKNLIFKGLCENASENCSELIQEFLFHELELDYRDICIDRAHRIGKRRGSGISRRPIIVAFRDYQDTVCIMDRAYKLKGSRYGLDRDYPHEISSARKLLWNRYKELKGSGRDVTLEYPARLMVGRQVVEDAFPGWYEVLRGDRVKPFISEEVKAASLRAEVRRRSRGENTNQESPSEGVTATGSHTELRSRRQSDNREADDAEDRAFYSNYVNSRLQSHERQFECRVWG